MTDTREFACDEFRCQIEPSLGSCIRGLWLGDVPVLQAGEFITAQMGIHASPAK